MAGPLRRYERPLEPTSRPNGETATDDGLITIGPDELDAALASSTLSEGARALAKGLIATSRPAQFPGGLGLEYGGLLKTATRPDAVGAHVREASEHLIDRGVDLLFVPGMSGYPVGAMYSLASGIPAVLLKKTHVPASGPTAELFAPGSFVIPSYTGEGDTVISADLDAVRAILAPIVQDQLAAYDGQERPRLQFRLAGADEIIDKATMAEAVSETAPEVCRAVIEALLRERGEERTVDLEIHVVAWVTPLLKGYNRSAERLAERFGIVPFAGLTLTSLSLDPHSIVIANLGLVALSSG